MDFATNVFYIQVVILHSIDCKQAIKKQNQKKLHPNLWKYKLYVVVHGVVWVCVPCWMRLICFIAANARAERRFHRRVRTEHVQTLYLICK